MSLTAHIYKNGIKLGAGTATAASTSITSYSATNSRVLGTNRQVQVQITTGGTSTGVYSTKVVNDGGATITLADPCPFV